MKIKSRSIVDSLLWPLMSQSIYVHIEPIATLIYYSYSKEAITVCFTHHDSVKKWISKAEVVSKCRQNFRTNQWDPHNASVIWSLTAPCFQQMKYTIFPLIIFPSHMVIPWILLRVVLTSGYVNMQVQFEGGNKTRTDTTDIVTLPCLYAHCAPKRFSPNECEIWTWSWQFNLISTSFTAGWGATRAIKQLNIEPCSPS